MSEEFSHPPSGQSSPLASRGRSLLSGADSLTLPLNKLGRVEMTFLAERNPRRGPPFCKVLLGSERESGEPGDGNARPPAARFSETGTK
jgi:hypothetical protein